MHYRRTTSRLLPALALAAALTTPSRAEYTTGGYDPQGGMTFYGGSFYGTTFYTSNNPSGTIGLGNGTVYQFTPNLGVTTLADFNASSGNHPAAALTPIGGGNFLGTTSSGGSQSLGNVFELTSGGAIATSSSWNFTGTNGSKPEASLTPAGDGSGNYYGTASAGGAYSAGTVYSFNATSGLGATVYSLTGNGNSGNNGATPVANLVDSGDHTTFYGTASGGGNSGEGTVFTFVAGNGITTYSSFTGSPNGASPQAAITLMSDGQGNYYGTTNGGGSNAPGTSTGAGTVYKFTPTSGNIPTVIDLGSDTGNTGYDPLASLTSDGNGNFYGTTLKGGAYGDGTIFKFTPSTSGSSATLVTVASFGPGSNTGINPVSTLVSDGNGNFYGVTEYGGSGLNNTRNMGSGTIYEYTPGGTFQTVVSFTGLTPSFAPEPSQIATLALIGMSLIGLIFRARARREVSRA